MSRQTSQTPPNYLHLSATVMRENCLRIYYFAHQWKKHAQKDIFEKLSGKLNELGLCWDNCVGVCTDGAGSMLGKNKGLAALVREVAPHVRFTHCMIHREALVAKTLPAELNAVLQTATKL